MIKDVMKNKVEKGGTEVCVLGGNCFNLNRVTKNTSLRRLTFDLRLKDMKE